MVIRRPDEAAWSDVAVAGDDGRAGSEPLTKQDFEALARFRFGIRRYLRFSEETVRSHGLTPQQYQLLLALKGFPEREWATVRELADRLQLRHHSVVELVNRAQRQGLVERAAHPDDARAVRVLAHPGRRADPGPPQRPAPRRAPPHGAGAEPSDLARRTSPALEDGKRICRVALVPRQTHIVGARQCSSEVSTR